MTMTVEVEEKNIITKHSQPQFDKIPNDLKEIDQWVVYKLIWDETKKKHGKPPYSLDGKNKQGFNVHYTFEQVMAAVKSGVVDGVGFAITPNDRFICIDLDGDNLDEIPKGIRSITEHSYAEISPSGNGLHVWFKGDKPSGAGGKQNRYTDKENYKIECFYDTGYLTMTGNAVNELPVEENQMILDYIYDSTNHGSEEKETPLPVDIPIPVDEKEDAVVIAAMFNSKNSGEKIKALLNGDTSLHNGDSSAADIALCNYLAIHTKCNATQIDRIFRASELMRDKWDVKHHSNGDTYGEGTINDAIAWAYPKLNEDGKNDKAKGLDLELNDRGKVLPNARNAEKILTNSPFNGVLAYDVFKGSEVINGNLPWRKRERPGDGYELWIGSDDKRLLHYFGVTYDFNAAKIIENAYLDVVRKNDFHPVKDYLEAQSWDGVPRAETLFIDYLGAEDTPYIRAVTRKWLAAAVTRIYEPGCKFDYMPVLVGPQGVGKSTLIAKLARDWFSDSLKNLDGKEAYEYLQSSWIFEFGELAAMRKNEVEEIKAFITKQTDSYRVAYERVVSDFPRKCVFIGTTNRSDFLRDQTGNRRFWAIETNPLKRKYEINDFTDIIVGQIWAEVFNLYKQGEKLYLDPQLEAEAGLIQESHMEGDPRVGLIEDYLDRLLPVEWNTLKIYERINFIASDRPGEMKRERVCAAEIWSECLGNDHKNFKPFEASAIYDILRKISGWEERKPNRTTFKHYGKQTTFIRST